MSELPGMANRDGHEGGALTILFIHTVKQAIPFSRTHPFLFEAAS